MTTNKKDTQFCWISYINKSSLILALVLSLPLPIFLPTLPLLFVPAPGNKPRKERSSVGEQSPPLPNTGPSALPTPCKEEELWVEHETEALK